MQDAADTLTLPAAPEASQGVPPTLSRYELLREAGRGGMSVVYEARNRRTGETVAVKVLNTPTGMAPDQAQDLLARFIREARTVAGLTHPNVVTIHGMDEEGGRHFLVMEFLRGETLRERLLRGPMTPDQAEPVLRQVAGALDAVHARGVVHRDVKPSNVMLMMDGAAKLLDFGIARRLDDAAITGTGPLVGSPAYMAPEHVRGGAGTPASDIWSLGVLLYEMLSGGTPFPGQSVPAVLRQVTHEPPAPLPDLPTPIQRVLRRALEKDPARRYPTARALADALHTALPGYQLDRRRSLPPWAWGVLLVPVLLGASLVLLSRYHPFAPPASLTLHAPVVDAPAVIRVPPVPPALPAPDSAPRPALRRAAVPHAARPRQSGPRQGGKQSHPAKKQHRTVSRSKRAVPKFTHAVRQTRRRTHGIRRRAVVRTSAWQNGGPFPHHAASAEPRRALPDVRPREPRRALSRPALRQMTPPASPNHGPRRHDGHDKNDPSSDQGLEHYIYSPESTAM